MNTKTKIYTSPSMHAYSVEMEEGIAAASTIAPGESAPIVNDYVEGEGGSDWNVDGF